MRPHVAPKVSLYLRPMEFEVSDAIGEWNPQADFRMENRI
jgi:hypothetical protein